MVIKANELAKLLCGNDEVSLKSIVENWVQDTELQFNEIGIVFERDSGEYKADSNDITIKKTVEEISFNVVKFNMHYKNVKPYLIV